MTVQSNKINYSEPPYYHRQYSNDIGAPSITRSWSEQTNLERFQRVANVALPFITLYKPLGFPLSLGLGGMRTLSCLSQLYSSFAEGSDTQIKAYQLLQTGISVVSLAGTVLAHPLGMLIATGQDLIVDVSNLGRHVQNGDYKKALEDCANILNNSLYLAIFLHGGLEVSIASLGMQILLGVYHAQEELKEGRYLEGAGHVGMAMIRGQQMTQQMQMLQRQKLLHALPHEYQEAREREAIKNDPCLREKIGDSDYVIKKTTTGYLIETDQGMLHVDLRYLPNRNRCSPGDFTLDFHDLQKKKTIFQ